MIAEEEKMIPSDNMESRMEAWTPMPDGSPTPSADTKTRRDE